MANLGRQTAEALEHAHTVGVIHRDVKPANLLVDQQGKIWITDFGLAQFHAEAGLTRTGDMMGTLRYMSPEQAIGNRVVLDHRTDIYSLGVTLYELLTLEPVFAGSDRADLLRRIIEDEPRSMHALEPAIPVELETIVLKALAKTPAERYATAQELADDLQRFLNDEPIRARRPTPLGTHDEMGPATPRDCDLGDAAVGHGDGRTGGLDDPDLPAGGRNQGLVSSPERRAGADGEPADPGRSEFSSGAAGHRRVHAFER